MGIGSFSEDKEILKEGVFKTIRFGEYKERKLELPKGN